MDVGSVVADSEPLSPLTSARVDWPGSEDSTVVSDHSYLSVTIPARTEVSSFLETGTSDVSDKSLVIYKHR